jgi:hypothetical protein
MRYLFIALSLIFYCSCISENKKTESDSLKQWIYENHERLEEDVNTIINNDLAVGKRDSNWLSSSIVTTIYSPNSLGELANITGGSSDCIVVELTFYNDKLRKKEVVIAAQDSSCSTRVNAIVMTPVSIGSLIFRKAVRPLY